MTAGTVTVERGSFIIRFEGFDSTLVRAATRLPGRAYSLELKGWMVPIHQAAAVREFADEFRLGMKGQARVRLLRVAEKPKLHYTGTHFEVRYDFADQTLGAGIASMKGASWFQPARCWVVPGEAALRLAAWAAKVDAVVSMEAMLRIEQGKAEALRITASAAGDTDYQLRDGFGLEPYDYQRAGIEYMVRHAAGRGIIGDEPGVGKTAQALGVIHQLQAMPAVIVVPASLKRNWRREAERALPYATVQVLSGRKAQEPLAWADITIINYDILDAWLPILPTPRGAVADESHLIKNPAIMRTRATLELFERVPQEQDTARLCLSGTPIENKQAEVWTQIEAVGRLEDFGGKKAKAKYAGRNVALNRDMRATCYVRRNKVDVWKGAPERRWAPIVVEGDPRIMVEYRHAEANIVEYLGKRAEEAALRAGNSSVEAQEAAWKAELRAEAAQHLVAITHLKKLAARAKHKAAVDWAKTFLDGDATAKLGIFGWHHDIMEPLATALKAVTHNGKLSETQKDAAVRAFQEDSKTRVFVGQIKAAGLGITLTAASNALIVEQGWTPGGMDQVLDRFHRRGQDSDVTGWLMLTEGTIDYDIAELIEHKRKEVDGVVDGIERDETGGGSILQDLVVKLAEKAA
jgi:SWI/SNF-related matrix-associated actin-dependent regulator 1 of chromatin subfamily A